MIKKTTLKFEGLDKFGYESLLAEIKAYPRGKGEQIVVVRKRRSRPRTVEVMIRSNLIGMIVMDITLDAGSYVMYELVGYREVTE